MESKEKVKQDLDEFFDLAWTKYKSELVKALTKKETARFFFYLGEKFLEQKNNNK